MIKPCLDKIDEMNSADSEWFSMQSFMQKYYDYYRTGIIQDRDDGIVLVKEDGDETDLMYFEDYTQEQNRQYLFYGVKNLQEKISEDDLQDLDEYKASILQNRDPEAKKVRTERSKTFMDEVQNALQSLKKADVKRNYERSGKKDELELLKKFYETMLTFKVGR